jgi:hypothetical protein
MRVNCIKGRNYESGLEQAEQAAVPGKALAASSQFSELCLPAFGLLVIEDSNADSK